MQYPDITARSHLDLNHLALPATKSARSLNQSGVIRGTLLGKAAQLNANNFQIHLDLVQMYLHTGHLDKAKNLFYKLPEEAQKDPKGKELDGILFFSEAIANAPDIQVLQKILANNPEDCQALHFFAGLLMLNEQVENALQTLLTLFAVNRDFEESLPQRSLVKSFEMISAKAPELVTM